MIRRGLLLACSARKRSGEGLTTALERYDGPLFRVCRRALAAGAEVQHVWILSAKFGLISGEHQLPFYDQLMTESAALRLRERVGMQLTAEIASMGIESVFIAIGKRYERAVETAWDLIPDAVRVVRASGSIGGMSAQLHDWLHGQRRVATHVPLGRASLLGVSVSRTPEEVLAVAEQLLYSTPATAGRVQHWFVSVGSQRVAPKSLVAQLTGLPVGRFRTADAVRFLAQLGVSVEAQATQVRSTATLEWGAHPC